MINMDAIYRRSFLKNLGAAGAMACSTGARELGMTANYLQTSNNTFSATASMQAATRAERMAWWHAAKFGMFIHWGLYSLLGQHEWALEAEGISIPQYELMARHFTPKPNTARKWAKLAQRAGQKYMVMTTKHHERFCMFDTKLVAAQLTGMKSKLSGSEHYRHALANAKAGVKRWDLLSG